MPQWLSNVFSQDKASQRKVKRNRQSWFLRSWTLSCLSTSQVLLERHQFEHFIIWASNYCNIQKIVFCVSLYVIFRQESYQQDHQEVCFSEFRAEWLLCCLSQWGPFQSGPAAGHVGSGGGRLGYSESWHWTSFSTESKAAQKTRPHWILCRLGLHSGTFSAPPQTGTVNG